MIRTFMLSMKSRGRVVDLGNGEVRSRPIRSIRVIGWFAYISPPSETQVGPFRIICSDTNINLTHSLQISISNRHQDWSRHNHSSSVKSPFDIYFSQLTGITTTSRRSKPQIFLLDQRKPWFLSVHPILLSPLAYCLFVFPIISSFRLELPALGIVR